MVHLGPDGCLIFVMYLNFIVVLMNKINYTKNQLGLCLFLPVVPNELWQTKHVDPSKSSLTPFNYQYLSLRNRLKMYR